MKKYAVRVTALAVVETVVVVSAASRGAAQDTAHDEVRCGLRRTWTVAEVKHGPRDTVSTDDVTELVERNC